MATKVETWLALGSVLMAIFSWVGQQWQPIADQGWPAVLTFGVALSCVATVILFLATLMITGAWRSGRVDVTPAPDKTLPASTALAIPAGDAGEIDRLRDELQVLREAARAQARKQDLEFGLRGLENLIQRYRQHADLHVRTAEQYDAATDESGWDFKFYEQTRDLRDVLDDIRHHCKEYLGEDLDFKSTPRLAANPFSGNWPFIDNIPSEASRYEYKKFSEQAERAGEIIDQLPGRFRSAIATQEYKIREAGEIAGQQ